MNDVLLHRGTPHEGDIPHSGRYEWGSGANPNQHSTETVSQAVRRLKLSGMSESDIASELGFKSTTELRKEISRETQAAKAAKAFQIQQMKNHGYAPETIAERLGMPVRTVYDYLENSESKIAKATKNEILAEQLKNIVDEKGGYIDVGAGTEYLLNTNSTRLSNAIHLLEEEGYSVHTVKVKNVTDPTKFTNVKVLCKPDTTWSYIQNHQELIQSIEDYTIDGNDILQVVKYPESISSDRVAIRYADEGGKDYDGVMLIRRGVEDLSLGNSNYAQVRIAVDGTHYLKGMALYADDKDFPDGVDILFNTNKTSDVPKLNVLKEIKNSEDLPFGAVIPVKGQSYYEDPKGKYIRKNGIYIEDDSNTSDERYSLSAVNKLKEEGDWNEYSKTLASQMLSKQSISLIQKQLDLTYAEKAQEFEDIKSLTNPEIKKKLLLEFASDCDASAVDLKATALPGQTNKVILPLTCIRDDEIYAPGYENGTKVALIRYPHAGLFEIPVLVVNNNNREARRILGTTPIDAVGITSKVAQKLSGADFDGDTVVVIPMSDKVHIQSQEQLKGLKDFETDEYKGYEGMPIMTDRQKGLEMGMVSNLITDMTLQGATAPELERAVKHSMVVIDAQKHKLNWKLSEEQNGIAALRKQYQGKASGGASTLISKASSETRVPERATFNPNQDIDPNTGEVIYRPSKTVRNVDEYGNVTYTRETRTYQKYEKLKEVNPETGKKEVVYTTNQYGKKVPVYKTDEDGNLVSKTVAATQKSTKMMEAKDAFELSSGTPKEEAYARYANALKGMANQARLEYLHTENTKVNASAKTTYATEIETLKAKLENAVLNSPRERQAQVIASNNVSKVLRYQNLTAEEEKKLRQQSLAQARAQVGANKKSVQIEINDKEWEAIQNGAISSSLLSEILKNTDTDKLKERAIPRTNNSLSSSQINLIKSRANSGFTIDEIAKSLGISTSTVSKYLKE